MPPASESLHRLLDELQGVAVVWLCSTMNVKDMAVMRRLWEQTYKKGEGYITCPLPYLYLLNYSMSTIRTYHSLLLRFFNGHKEKELE